jgi:succinate-semialdehyde dehydrogenase/glutarate-semialdehyde dehydrogenase
MAYASTNPYDGALLQTFPEHTDAEVEAALARASACFNTEWRRHTFGERAAVMRKAADILRARPDEFARLLTLEMGKLIAESHQEVALTADIFEYNAAHAEEFLAPEPIDTPGGEARVEHTPLGVLLGIQPWNFPYYQLVRVAAPNLMAGNVMLVKHASSVPQSALAFERLLAEAGGAGAYANLFISRQQIERLIADSRVLGVAFTGGDAAGAAIARQAGEHLKKSTMELGGSDPLIVLEDADLEKTVKWALWGRIHNCGQSCVASKRLVAVKTIADRFLSHLIAEFKALQPGDPFDPSTTLAPLSSESAVATLQDQVARAIAHGARIVTGGKRIDRRGAFMEPTILTDVAPDHPVYREELFGPVAMFFDVADEDAAVALANDSPYGLGGGVFTCDIERGRRVARRIESGMVFINHPAWTAPELPFGGIKRSGYGRELWKAGIQEFVNKKLIRTVPIDAPP